MKKLIVLLSALFTATFAIAQTDLAVLTEKANQGDAEAQYNLAILYYNGNVVSQSYEEAVKWYRKSAEQGYAKAQNNLGICYIFGKGVPQSDTEGVKWVSMSAKQGNAIAQCNLGYYYENGIGIAKSEAEAARWYRKAASQGDEDAKKFLDDLNRKSSIEYYMLGGGLVSLMSGPSCFILTAYANGTTASLPITITGVGNNGDCVYSVYGTNMMYAASDAEHSYLLVGSPNPEKYERCTPAEATEILQQEAQIFGSTNPTPNNVSGYGTNSGTNSGTTGYESVGSASATVISSGYGSDTSWSKSVDIYRKGSSYYIKIGGSYYHLSPNSDSSYMGHSTNGANYSAMVNSSFYFVRIN